MPGGRREGPNTFLGNPDLQPETSDALEVGVAWSAGGRELQVMVFEQRVHDLIEVALVAPGPAPGLGTYTYRNLARATLRGVEASGAMALGAGFSARVWPGPGCRPRTATASRCSSARARLSAPSWTGSRARGVPACARITAGGSGCRRPPAARPTSAAPA